MKIEDYDKYYINCSDHYLIPRDELIELFDEMVNWREESKQLKEKIKKVNENIDDLLFFNDFEGITKGIGNVAEEIKFYLSDCKTLDEFRHVRQGSEINENK